MSSPAEQAWLTEAIGGSVSELYASLGVELRDRGASEAPVRCFANPAAHSHDDRNASCSVNMLTGLWHCKGCGESGNAYRAAVALGRSETQARDLAKSYGLFLESVRSEPGERPKKPRLPTEVAVRKWRHALRGNQRVLDRLGEVKGWTPYGIQRLGVGWDGQRVVFVVRNSKRKIVGVVRYLPGGKPKTVALPGSKRDLFPAPESIPNRYPVFIVEGEGDAVAVWSLGLRAVAVPGSGSWRREWGWRFAGRPVVVALCDADQQGRGLGDRLRADVAGCRVVDVAPERSDGYDVGDMLVEASRDGGAWQLRQMLEVLAS